MSGNRVALVTGAANGIGCAVAMRLAADGATIIALDRDAAGLEALAAEIDAQTTALDLTDTAALADAIDALTLAVGAPDILVNNVGGSSRERAALFSEADLSALDTMLDLNLRTAVAATRRVLPAMLARGWGRVINIASEAALVGGARMWDYAAAKAGVIGFTRAVAREVAGSGVTINAVAPGLIRTAAFDAMLPEIRARVVASLPGGIVGEPADVAAAVAFFASDGARHVTGQTLSVNGGTSFN